MLDNFIKSLTLSDIEMAIPETVMALCMQYMTIFVKKINLKGMKISIISLVLPV